LSAADLFSLAGKRALVTGASGGLGLHFARVLHEAGAAVVLAARRTELIEAEASALGSRAVAVTMDVASEASIVAAFEHIARTGPLCDVVVNNAGISGANVAVAIEALEWESVIGVNLTGAFYVARESARRLSAAKQPGSIVNIASILALRGIMGVAPYMASKAGLLHLTRALALEFARASIRVNALCPGYFETDINREFMETEFAQKMVRRIPQRRLGELNELSGPLLLLASDAGAFMTGSAITVDGGQSINSL
jgi:NAD(P)-dependent dehydrogenase (short-subunit alcohol dehydrogenase family)